MSGKRSDPSVERIYDFRSNVSDELDDYNKGGDYVAEASRNAHSHVSDTELSTSHDEEQAEVARNNRDTGDSTALKAAPLPLPPATTRKLEAHEGLPFSTNFAPPKNGQQQQSKRNCSTYIAVMLTIIAVTLIATLIMSQACGWDGCFQTSSESTTRESSATEVKPIIGTTPSPSTALTLDPTFLENNLPTAAPSTFIIPTVVTGQPSLEASTVESQSVVPTEAETTSTLTAKSVSVPDSTSAPVPDPTSATAPAPVPTASKAPTTVSVPSTEAPRAEQLTSYLNEITLTDRIITVPDPSSSSDLTVVPAEDLALQWLIADDPLLLLPNSTAAKFRILQRYAILTLWFQPAPPAGSWTYDLGLTGLEECSWFGYNIACDIVDLGGDLGWQSVLTILNFASNNINGAIPSDLGLLTHLTYLNLGGNALSKTLPDSLGRLSNLDLFSIELNAMTGTIPSSYGKWSKITQAWFGTNDFTGSVPAEFCDISNPKAWTALETDCPAEVTCSCCTNCPAA